MWHSHPTGGWIESCLLLWQHVCQGHEGELLLALAPVIQVGPRLGRAESNTVRSKLSSDFIQFAVVAKRCLRNVRHALRTAGALLFVRGVGAPALLASRRLASARKTLWLITRRALP